MKGKRFLVLRVHRRCIRGRGDDRLCSGIRFLVDLPSRKRRGHGDLMALELLGEIVMLEKLLTAIICIVLYCGSSQTTILAFLLSRLACMLRLRHGTFRLRYGRILLQREGNRSPRGVLRLEDKVVRDWPLGQILGLASPLLGCGVDVARCNWQ